MRTSARQMATSSEINTWKKFITRFAGKGIWYGLSSFFTVISLVVGASVQHLLAKQI